MKLLSRSRTRPLQLEFLEARVQPGSVLPWPAWSDLDLSLAELERDTRRLRSDTEHSAQLRLLDQAAAQPFGVLLSAPAFQAESIRTTESVEAAPNPAPASDFDLTQAASRLQPIPAPVPQAGTPIMAVQARTGATRPSGLSFQLEQATAEAIDLQATDGWFNRAIDFQVWHYSAESAGGIEALLDWSTYLTGTTESSTARASALDASGNSYVTGWMEIAGDKYGFVVKYDVTGAAQYGTLFHAQDNLFQYRSTEPRGIAVDAEGSVYVGGTALRSTGQLTDGFALKLDPTGSEIVYGYAHGQLFSSSLGTGIAVDAAGRAYVTGSSQPPQVASPHVFIGRYSAVPNPARPMDYARAHAIRSDDGSIEFNSSIGNGIAVDPDGAFIYIAGGARYAKDMDLFGYKVQGSNGFYCGPPACYVYVTPPNLGDDVFQGVAVNAQGETYLSGTLVVNGTTPHAFLGKVNATGSDSPWAVIFDDTNHGYGVAHYDGNTYISGSANDAATLDAFTVKLDPTGQYLDGYSIDGSGDEIAYALTYRPVTDTVYLAGSTTSWEIATDGTGLYGLQDAFLASVGMWQ